MAGALTSDEPRYNCRVCGEKFGSLRELTAHYEKEHPEMIEDLMVPI